MLLHVALYWSQEFDSGLWSFAMSHVTWIWNKISHQNSGSSAEELFYRTKSNHADLNRAQVWGKSLFIFLILVLKTDKRFQNEKNVLL